MRARRVARLAAAAAVQRTPLPGAIVAIRRRMAGGRRVVVLGYHRVCGDFHAERRAAIESCLVSRETFRRHVEFLAGRFELATMSRAVDVLSGRARASRDLAVLTFDDGYRDVLEHAMPVLRDARAPATVYVSTGVVDSAGHFLHDRLFTLLCAWAEDEAVRRRLEPDATRRVAWARSCARGVDVRHWLHPLIERHGQDELVRLADALSQAAPGLEPPEAAAALGWAEVRELAAAGCEIGAHTVSHCVLTNVDVERVGREVRGSQEAIEEQLGRPVRHFAYCNGYYDEAVIGILRRRGFASAVTTEDRLNRLGDDPFRIARRCVWEGATMGVAGQCSSSLVACQLDDAWAGIGLTASTPGLRRRSAGEVGATSRLA